MASPRTDGLSSEYDGPGLLHSDMDFTPSPRQEKSKKAMSDSPTRPMSDGRTMGASSTYEFDDIYGHTEEWCIVEPQAETSIDVIVPGSYPSGGNGFTRSHNQERDIKMTREIERLLNDHDYTYAHTMTNLEKN